jgi:hypothetical protein
MNTYIFFQNVNFLTSFIDDFVDDIESRKVLILPGNDERGKCCKVLKSCPLGAVTVHSSLLFFQSSKIKENKKKSSVTYPEIWRREKISCRRRGRFPLEMYHLL